MGSARGRRVTGAPTLISLKMLSHLEDHNEASYLIHETVTEWAEQHVLITTRLEYTRRAIMTALPNIVDEDANRLQSALLSKETSKYFEGSEFSPHDFSHVIVADESVGAHLNGVLSFIGSMALVYSHSYFEELLMRCFRIFTLADPVVWLSRITGKQSTLDDINTRGLSVIVQEKVDEQVLQIEKSGLIKKIEAIEGMICSSHDPSPVNDFTYNKEEIERIDKLRHDHAHRRQDAYDIKDARRDVDYLLNSALHFFALTQQKVGINGAQRPTTTSG